MGDECRHLEHLDRRFDKIRNERPELSDAEVVICTVGCTLSGLEKLFRDHVENQWEMPADKMGKVIHGLDMAQFWMDSKLTTFEIERNLAREA